MELKAQIKQCEDEIQRLWKQFEAMSAPYEARIKLYEAELRQLQSIELLAQYPDIVIGQQRRIPQALSAEYQFLKAFSEVITIETIGYGLDRGNRPCVECRISDGMGGAFWGVEFVRQLPVVEGMRNNG